MRIYSSSSNLFCVYFQRFHAYAPQLPYVQDQCAITIFQLLTQSNPIADNRPNAKRTDDHRSLRIKSINSHRPTATYM